MSPDFTEYEEIKARHTDNDDSTWADLPAAAPWPKLDDAAYHGLPGKIVKTIEPHSESDPVAILVQFLVMVGNAIGRVPHFLVESDRHGLNLFAVLVGETADGRKGVSGGRVSHVMGGAESDWANQRILKGMASGEGLIWAVRDPLKEPMKSGKGPSAKFVDTVTDPGVKDKRLLVFEHEFCRALAVMKRPGNTLSAVLRDAWDGNNLGTLTKNSPTRATGAHISIIGHITPDELRAELDQTSMVNGFANRFLFVAFKRSKLLPFGGDLAEDDVRELSYRTHKVLESVRTCSAYRRIGFAEPTRPIWERQYESLSAARPGLVGSVTARGTAQTVRLATLYALLDERNAIDPEHLTAAIAVWNYCEATARYVFGDALGDYVADEILQALRRCPDGMTRTEISNLFGRNVGGGKITEALRLLFKHGKVRPASAKSNGQGRPTEVWYAT
jgi:hypothetical protein